MNQGYPKDGGNRGRRRSRSARLRGTEKRPSGSGRRIPSAKSPTKQSVFAKKGLSRAPIGITQRNSNEPLIGLGMIHALLGICILTLLGGGGHVFAEGFALLLVGFFVLKYPPRTSLGRCFNVGAVLFLAGALMGLLPGGLGLLPEWREVGAKEHLLDLPLSSTISPIQNLEAFLLLAASLCWFYCLSQLRINFNGRKWILFWVSVFSLFVGIIAMVGLRYGWHYPGSTGAESFGFFSGPGHMGWLLLLCGVFTFGYGLESLTDRSPQFLIGLPAAALCFIALVLGKNYNALLLYFVGIGLYSGLRILGAEISLRKRLAAVTLLYVAVIVSLSVEGGLIDLCKEDRLSFKAWKMFIEMPLTGIGLGNVSTLSVFYLENWQPGISALRLPNDFMWAACTMGIVGIMGLFVMLVGVAREIEISKIFRVGSLRALTLLTCLIYLLVGFTGEGRHALTLVFLVLLLLALSYPLGDRFKGRLPSWLWRGCGSLFVIVGSVWIIASLVRVPIHSKLISEANELKYQEALAEQDVEASINSLNRLIRLEPTYWYWYHERAKLMLASREYEKAELDFDRARFLEPYLIAPPYWEGEAWFGYRGSKAEVAWREALKRAAGDSEGLFARIMKKSANNFNKRPVVLRLAREAPGYGAIYLEQADKALFLQELNHYLQEDPSLGQFNREERTRILLRWVRLGEFQEPLNYLEQYASSLNLAWYLQSYVYQNGALFEKAVGLLRAGLSAPMLPDPELDSTKVALLERELASRPRNYKVGLQLISLRLMEEAYEEGIVLTNQLLEYSDAPPEILYWQAEFYSRRGNTVESWLSLEAYAQAVLNLQRL